MLINQVKFRKKVLEQKFPEKKWLQVGEKEEQIDGKDGK